MARYVTVRTAIRLNIVLVFGLFSYGMYKLVYFASTSQRQVYHKAAYEDKEPFCKNIFELKRLDHWSPGCVNQEVDEFASPFNETLFHLAVELVVNGTHAEHFLRNEFFAYLARPVPKILKRDQRGNTVIRQKFPHETFDSIPFLPRGLQSYGPSEVRQCLMKRRREGRPNYLAFVGDSRVRRIVEAIIELLLEFHVNVRTKEGLVISGEEFLGETGNVEWAKYKSQFTVWSEMIPDFKVEFYWAPFLDRGDEPIDPLTPLRANARKHLQKFLDPNKEETPATSSEELDRSSMVATSAYSAASSSFSPATEVNQHKKISPTVGHPTTALAVNRSEAVNTVSGLSLTTFSPGTEATSAYSPTSSPYSEPSFLKTTTVATRTSRTPRPQFGTYTGGLDIMSKWITDDIARIPNIIVIGTGIWGLALSSDPLWVIDRWTVQFSRNSFSVLEKLSRRTNVLLAPLEYTKDYIVYLQGKYSPYVLQRVEYFEWLSNGQMQLLPKDVVRWTTLTPFFIAAYDDCVDLIRHNVSHDLWPTYRSFSRTDSWKCGDILHSGYPLAAVALNMLMNSLCNDQVTQSDCCM